ncbi:MAG: FtsX-like permease family protein [Pseudomonadota bacterium]
MNRGVMWYARRQRQRAFGMVMALAIGVAALVAVSTFAERLSGALQHGAAEALGGDLVLVADRAIPPHFRAEADRLGLRSASSTSFPSMILADGRTRLVEIKAVSPEYPLLGELRVDGATASAPAAGRAWLEPDALAALGLDQGATFSLGQLTLQAGGRLDREPDRAPSVFAIGPRVMIAEADLAASGLLGFGSRASFRLHLAGEAAALRDFAAYTRRHPERGLRLEGLDETRPELREALSRAEGLLRVSGLLALLLAGLAVGIGMQDRLRAQLDAAAALRALGAPARFITTSALLALLPTAALGSLIGVLLGYAIQPLLPLLLRGVIPADLPPPGPMPALLGLLAGPVITLAFALPAVLRLRATPVLRILRRHLEPPPWGPAGWGALAAGIILLGALVAVIAGPTRLTAAVLGGALALGLVLLLLASLPILLARRRWLPTGAAILGRLAQPGRRAHLTLATLGLGLMALTLAFSLRTDLLEGWAARLPADAPNRFVINLLEEQKAPFASLLDEAGLPAPVLRPMIRGRLLTIDGQPVSERPLAEGRARALAEREFNLSMAEDHPADNRIIAGRHWRAEEAGQHWLSVEEGIAKRLGIGLGSRLVFEIAGETWEGTVLNLRQVRWDSFNVNFFVSAPPGTLDGYPATWITSFHLPDAKAGLADRLVTALPNITIIDIRAALTQVREVLARIEAAVGLVLGFVLISAWLVLWNAAAGTARTRRFETALLRTLGASRHWLRRQLVGEYALLGLLAGLLAALAATLVSALLGRLILEEWLPISPLPWLATPLLGAALSAVAGWLSLRGTLNTPPALVLREAG